MKKLVFGLLLIPMIALASYVIPDFGVTTRKIAPNAVTQAKLAARSTYTMTITSASATSGWIYTNNSQTFTLVTTIAPSTTAYFQGTGSPLSSGTLTCVTSSGCSSNITYSAVTNGAPTALAGGMAVSLSSGNFSGSATSLTAVTNLSVTLTTTGRPVHVCIQSDGSGVSSYIGFSIGAGYNNLSWTYALYRGASQTANWYNFALNSGSPQFEIFVPAYICYDDQIAAGTYTYAVKYDTFNSASFVFFAYTQLTAFEL